MKSLISSLIVIAMAGMLVAALIGCAGEKYQPEKGTPAVIKGDTLEIAEHTLTKGEYGDIVVKGIAKNITSSTIASAELEVIFYDSMKTILSAEKSKIEDLGPGESRDFAVRYLGATPKNVDGYEIEIGSISLAGE